MKKKFFEYLVFLIIAIGAGPVGAAVWQWSETASTNASVDTSINWAEGMAPSSINDSARAMMARLAEWRQDISGANVLTGTSTAYVLSTAANQNNVGLCAASAALTDGQMITFRANVTNGVAPQITVDNCASAPLQSTAGVALPSGSIIAGSPYRASYNLANTAWVMEAIYGNPYNIPLGGFLYSSISTPPNSNFVAPAGQCLSTTTYNAYYVGLGSPAQGACSSGQWPIVDVRARILVALDNLGGTPANRLTSATNGCGTAFTSFGASCVNGLEGHALPQSALPNIGLPFSVTVSSSAGFILSSSPLSGGVVVGSSGSGVAFNGSPSTAVVSSSGSGTTSSMNGNTSQTNTYTVDPNIGVYVYLRVI